jgi:hypothetical protein
VGTAKAAMAPTGGGTAGLACVREEQTCKAHGLREAATGTDSPEHRERLTIKCEPYQPASRRSIGRVAASRQYCMRYASSVESR